MADESQVECPICQDFVIERDINVHIDSGCIKPSVSSLKSRTSMAATASSSKPSRNAGGNSKPLAPIFNLGRTKRPFSSQSSTTVDEQEGAIVSSSSPQPDALVTSASATFRAPNPANAVRTASKDHFKYSEEKTSDGPPTKRVRTSVAANLRAAAPLAEKLRPTTLDEFVGHEHVTAEDSLLRGLLEGGGIGSMILWGPAGSGKTTLARLMASRTNSTLKELSATSSGTAEVRSAFEEAKNALKLTGRKTILFMDEIHRFNKAQQDLFLPYVEQGVVQLIGATTENPSFKLNNALLSRCRVFQLDRLSDDNILAILKQAVKRVTADEDLLPTAQRATAQALPLASTPSNLDDHNLSAESGYHATFPKFPQVTEAILKSITSFSLGDARTALSLLELVLTCPATTKENVLLTSLKKSVVARYDRSGDDRYDMISALHKSVRGSDGSASMYWLARMLTAGEDPLYIARRLIVIASEDVGLADNHALPLATATYAACTTIGMPECRINLAHCVAYLSEAPKSTRAYEAYKRAEAAANEDATLPVPINMRNAPTSLMKDLGYGRGYLYNPEYSHPVYNDFLPLGVPGDGDFLRKEGDLQSKVWNEDLLREWEWKGNGGKDWEGRSQRQANGD